MIVLTASACTFRLDLNVTPPAYGEGPQDSGSQDMEASASAGDAGDAAETESHRDAALPGNEEDAASEPPPVRHPSCSKYLLPPMRELPNIASDARGRPSFDLWRDIPCADVADYPLCTPEALAGTTAWGCDSCWIGQPGDQGICSTGYGTTDCTVESELLSLRDGTCRTCAPIEAHARACCARLPGFDCRAWPYPSDSQPGEACARHADCEPGLVCIQGGVGYGMCVCPFYYWTSDSDLSSSCRSPS
jgi:hypothetical protein